MGAISCPCSCPAGPSVSVALGAKQRCSQRPWRSGAPLRNAAHLGVSSLKTLIRRMHSACWRKAGHRMLLHLFNFPLSIADSTRNPHILRNPMSAAFPRSSPKPHVRRLSAQQPQGHPASPWRTPRGLNLTTCGRQMRLLHEGGWSPAPVLWAQACWGAGSCSGASESHSAMTSLLLRLGLCLTWALSFCPDLWFSFLPPLSSPASLWTFVSPLLS